MNSTHKRAPGKEMAHGFWKFLLGVAVIAIATIASAQNNSTLIGKQGLNEPLSMIRATVPDPNVPGAFITDYWVTDSVAGFCRLSPTGALELATCDINGTFEAHDYQAETNGLNGSNGYVFVASIDGVRRINFIPDATGTRTVIDAANTVVLGGAGSVFINNVAISGRNLPDSAVLGPDGKLYMVFVGNTDIWRVLNPLSPTFTVQGNKIERVGVTEGTGGRGTSLAWIGHDLWMEDVGFLNRIQNADQCFYTFPKCSAVLQFNNLFAHAGMASDQFISSIPNGRYLYWANGSRVMRYDTTTKALMQVWSLGGTVPPANFVQGYSMITGLNFIQTLTPTVLADGSAVEDMTIVNDPEVTALFPPAVLQPPRIGAGQTWLLAASPTLAPGQQCDALGTPVVIQNPPPCAIGVIGNPGAIDSPAPVANKRAILLASGVTHPRGLLWLNSNWWVSDEALGFCRIDQNPITGFGTLTNCFQPDPSFIPGQPAADAPAGAGLTQNVYVPDASGLTSQIFRFIFTPSPTGGSLSQSGILDGTGSRKGTQVESVALPTGPFNDGSLYIVYSNSGFVEKITSPATAPGAPVQIARLFNGIGAISMAFNGNDLYISELGPPPIAGQFIKKGVVTNLLKASPSMAQGSASPAKRAIARLQTPQIIVENPGGFAVGPATVRPACLPPPGVKLSPSVPDDPATTPALYIGT